MNEFERRSLHFLESIDTLLKVLIVEVRKVQPAAEQLQPVVKEAQQEPGQHRRWFPPAPGVRSSPLSERLDPPVSDSLSKTAHAYVGG